MVTSVSNLSGTKATSAIALQALKTELTAALQAAGVKDASASDKTPKGFPDGVSWQNAYKMVSFWVEDNNPATPGTLTLSTEKLAKNIGATKALKELGYTNLLKFKKDTSVEGALDSLFQSKTNGLLGSTLAKAGIYDMSAFPQGTTAYQAFKLIEDPANPGKVSRTKFTELKDSFSALSSLGIKSLQNFPRGATALEAKNVLEPKATAMLSMLGMSTGDFKKSNISALESMAVLSKLPDSIRDLKALPNGTTSAALASNASAAKKLVAMGYESLAPFAAMKSLGGKTITASDALAQINTLPVPADLPFPTKDNTERLFQSSADNKIKSYGAHNEIRNTLYVATTVDRVKPNPAPGMTIVTAAQVLAANALFWSKK
jgi:hypothetical protein